MKDTISAEGILLRMERLRQGKEQKEICTGICSVSTLSKIETGKQKADPVMLESLYRELGITYLSDPEAICRLQKTVDRFFEEIQYQREMKAWEELKQESEVIKHSPLAADWMVIGALMEGTGFSILKECRDYLTGRQLGWYLLALSGELEEDAVAYAEEAVRILQNSFSQVELLHILYMEGEYRKVLEWADKAVMQALEEGNLWTLAESYNMKGTVYACFNMEDLMLKEYKRAAHLLEESRWKKDLSNICYNIGATYLGIGRYEEAEQYLEQMIDKPRFMGYHKFALLYFRTGRRAEAWKALKKMEQCEAYGREKDLKEEILEVTRLELAGQTEGEDFLNVLENLMHAFQERHMFGYMMFFHDLLQRQYTSRRMYRKAYLLEEQFSDIQRKTRL